MIVHTLATFGATSLTSQAVTPVTDGVKWKLLHIDIWVPRCPMLSLPQDAKAPAE